MLIVWSMSSPDPIYTRFLYPSYVFFLLSVFILYDWIVSRSQEKGHKIVFVLLYVVVLAVNLYKIFIVL
jgi:hypothetical protein